MRILRVAIVALCLQPRALRRYPNFAYGLVKKGSAYSGLLRCLLMLLPPLHAASIFAKRPAT